jgi:hypothetical protein
MKIKITSLLLLVSISLASITLIDAEKNYELTLDMLRSFPQQEINTHREKNDKIINDKWFGVSLLIILEEYQIGDYDQLKFTSADNYQVRLSKQEINEYSPIIAMQRNENTLNEKKLRLVVPQIRDMFWIQDIASITTEQENAMPLPHTLFVAEQIIFNLDIVTDPAPFTKVSGYNFIDLVADIYPMLQGEFLLISSDGVSHKLDFEKYLKNAVLIIDEDRLNLQSPDMPGGMWIKNLAYIQMFDRVVFFKDQIKSLHNLSKISGWKELPESFMDQDGKQINSNTSFDAEIWENIRKVTWQK